MPVAVLGTIFGSLVVALTLVPFVASRVLKGGAEAEGNPLLRRINAGIERVYGPLLHRALARPWRALGGIFLLASLAVPLLMVIGSSLFPGADLPQFLVRIEMPRGTAIATTDAMVVRVEHRLRAQPDIAWTLANTGRGNPSLYYNSPVAGEDPALGEIGAAFHAWEPGKSQAILDQLRADFAKIPGAKIKIITFVQGALTEAPVAIRIVGPDMGTLTRLANRAEMVLRGQPELRDVANPLRVQRTDMQLEVDEARAQAGLARQCCAMAMATTIR